MKKQVHYINIWEYGIVPWGDFQDIVFRVPITANPIKVTLEEVRPKKQKKRKLG